MKQGDLVKWVVNLNHNYFNTEQNKIGIFLNHIETYDHWVLANVLDNCGHQQTVMLQKQVNPL